MTFSFAHLPVLALRDATENFEQLSGLLPDFSMDAGTATLTFASASEASVEAPHELGRIPKWVFVTTKQDHLASIFPAYETSVRSATAFTLFCRNSGGSVTGSLDVDWLVVG